MAGPRAECWGGAVPAVPDPVADLILGSSCLGCGRPGRVLCPPCTAGLPRTSGPAWPSPVPPGLALPSAVGEYDGLLRDLVLHHKEHGVLALARPLGGLLAVAVRGVLRGTGPVALVPVPSRRSSVRSRGYDPTAAMARTAAVALRRAGRPVVVAPLLRLRAGVLDQAGLDAEQRHANLTGSMACSSAALRALAVRHPRAHLVICDDVITTGATAREAQRALETVGVRPAGIAAVARTRRRGRTTGPPARLSFRPND